MTHMSRLFVVLTLGCTLLTGCATPEASPSLSTPSSATASHGTAAAPRVTTSQQHMTVEQLNAIRSAREYLNMAPFSRKGLIRQLSSDAGEDYPLKVATYAVDSLHVDYNDQAYRSAKQYLEMSGFSRKSLIQQLESSAGEGFTHQQAVYGVTKAGL